MLNIRLHHTHLFLNYIIKFFIEATLVSPSVMSFSTKAALDTTKLTNSLFNEINNSKKNESIPVIVWTTDIDQEDVQEEVEATTGIDSEEYFSQDNLTELTAVAQSITADDSLTSKEQMKKYLKETKAERKQQMEETEKYVGAKRKIAKAKYKAQNSNFAKQFLANKNILFSSSYAPMIIAEATTSEITRLAKKSNVVSIDYYDEAEKAEVDMATAKVTTRSSMLTNNEDLTGYGVKIGVYDEGCVDLTKACVAGTNVTNLTSTSSMHSTEVVGVIAGPQGIAPNAIIYSAGGTNKYTCLESLLDQNVRLINCCYGYSSGNYDTEAKFYDHICAQHNVTVVCSAGNTSTKPKISSQSMGYNVISVGAINDNGTSSISDDTIASFSTKDYNDVMKPEIYAPGQNINLPGLSGINGTSFATPIVTGICAQLMEAFPTLGRIPTLTKSLLLTTAHNLNDYRYDNVKNVTLDLRCGVVDAYAAFNVMSDSKFNYGYLLKSNTSNTWRSEFTATKTGTERMCYVWEINNNYSSTQTNHTSTSGLVVGQIPNITMVIEDSNHRVISSSTLTKTAFQICQFTAYAGDTYYVRVSTNQSLAENLYFSYTYL